MECFCRAVAISLRRSLISSASRKTRAVSKQWLHQIPCSWVLIALLSFLTTVTNLFGAAKSLVNSGYDIVLALNNYSSRISSINTEEETSLQAVSFQCLVPTHMHLLSVSINFQKLSMNWLHGYSWIILFIGIIILQCNRTLDLLILWLVDHFRNLQLVCFTKWVCSVMNSPWSTPYAWPAAALLFNISIMHYDWLCIQCHVWFNILIMWHCCLLWATRWTGNCSLS
jgi:hypothetical protein